MSDLNLQYPYNPYPTPVPAVQQFSLEQVQQLITQALQQHGLIQPPLDMAKFGEELLIAFGDNLSQQDATFFKDNLHKFIPYMKTQHGKDISSMLIEDFRANMQK